MRSSGFNAAASDANYGSMLFRVPRVVNSVTGEESMADSDLVGLQPPGSSWVIDVANRRSEWFKSSSPGRDRIRGDPVAASAQPAAGLRDSITIATAVAVRVDVFVRPIHAFL